MNLESQDHGFPTLSTSDVGHGGSNSRSEAQKERVSTACSYCRHRKVKCDGKKPKCTFCQHLGREVCEYTKVSEAENQQLRRRKRELRARRALERQQQRQEKGDLQPDINGFRSSTRSPYSRSSMSSTSHRKSVPLPTQAGKNSDLGRAKSYSGSALHLKRNPFAASLSTSSPGSLCGLPRELSNTFSIEASSDQDWQSSQRASTSSSSLDLQASAQAPSWETFSFPLLEQKLKGGCNEHVHFPLANAQFQQSPAIGQLVPLTQPFGTGISAPLTDPTSDRALQQMIALSGPNKIAHDAGVDDAYNASSLTTRSAGWTEQYSPSVHSDFSSTLNAPPSFSDTDISQVALNHSSPYPLASIQNDRHYTVQPMSYSDMSSGHYNDTESFFGWAHEDEASPGAQSAWESPSIAQSSSPSPESSTLPMQSLSTATFLSLADVGDVQRINAASAIPLFV